MRAAAIRRVQVRLCRLGFQVEVDGVFGPETKAALERFEASRGLEPDGELDAATWRRLFAGDPAELRRHVLALTASFETGSGDPACFGAISGDFDGQGWSWGALQWNFGQGSLPPLLRRALVGVEGELASALRAVLARPRGEQLAWARARSDGRGVCEPWRGFMQQLGKSRGGVAAQLGAAAGLFAAAQADARSFGLGSERALALLFDVRVQNGPTKASTAREIRAAWSRLGACSETRRLEVFARVRSQAAALRWRSDVLSRKMTIASGRGVVHGRSYDLESEFGITLFPFS